MEGINRKGVDSKREEYVSQCAGIHNLLQYLTGVYEYFSLPLLGILMMGETGTWGNDRKLGRGSFVARYSVWAKLEEKNIILI